MTKMTTIIMMIMVIMTMVMTMMMTIMIIMKVKSSHPPTVGTTVIKNCEPFVFGPALAMLTVYGRSCLKLR